MSAERYLMKFEANPSLTHIERTPPPKISNFYWKNDAEEKFKVFIPTPNRYVYYNLEEYVGDIQLNEIDGHGWKLAKKCVLLAVSNTYTADQAFINHMEFLIANLSAWNERNANYQLNIESDVNSINNDLNRHYILTKYFVDDIINVQMESRGIYAKFKGAITIHSDHDNAGVIPAMNIGFELAAERFANDHNHEVYAYGRI